MSFIFNIKYEIWYKVCSIYREQIVNKKTFSLQWYAINDEVTLDFISSEDFFNNYIETGYFLMDDNLIISTANYLQKSDGTYRNAQLLSPILFFLLQSISYTIENELDDTRPKELSVYYAGNINEDRIGYKKDYDNYFNEINEISSKFSYYMKFDFKDFFDSISINKLINKLSQKSIEFSHITLMFYKEFLSFLNDGYYPTIENSVGSSYLATKVYLEKSDNEFFSYLLSSETINDFKFIRYVDDLYVLFNTNKTSKEVNRFFIESINYYNSILFEDKLKLNVEKTYLKPIKYINEDIKKSPYSESFNEMFLLERISIDYLLKFLESLEKIILNKGAISPIEYQELIKTSFTVPDSEYSPTEIFNNFIYFNNDIYSNNNIMRMLRIINSPIILSVDTKRLSTLVLRSKNRLLIKMFLNNLFIRHRLHNWYQSDSAIAVNYFIQRNFNHSDLIEVFKDKNLSLYNYFSQYILKNADDSNDSILIKYFIEMKISNRSLQIYFLHLVNFKKNNYSISHSYFKSFFDRVSAEIADYINTDDHCNYQKYYKESNLKNFYMPIKEASKCINTAHNIRNDNPVAHASSKNLSVEKKVDNTKYINNINSLKSLLIQKLNSENLLPK